MGKSESEPIHRDIGSFHILHDLIWFSLFILPLPRQRPLTEKKEGKNYQLGNRGERGPGTPTVQRETGTRESKRGNLATRADPTYRRHPPPPEVRARESELASRTLPTFFFRSPRVETQPGARAEWAGERQRGEKKSQGPPRAGPNANHGPALPSSSSHFWTCPLSLPTGLPLLSPSLPGAHLDWRGPSVVHS